MTVDIYEQRELKKGTAFCWQDKKILKFLRKKAYKGQRLTTAIAIYVSLTEIASNNNEKKNDGFPAYYSQIGEKVGKSSSTAKRYCNDFIKFGILSKRNKKKGKINLANIWILRYWSIKIYCGHNSDLRDE